MGSGQTGRPKGYPKTGGKVKGVPTLAVLLKEELRKRNIDVLGSFFRDLELIEDTPFQDAATKRAELKIRLLEFMYPKPKFEIGLTLRPPQREEAEIELRDEIARLEAITDGSESTA